jgi:hypothetical protein
MHWITDQKTSSTPWWKPKISHHPTLIAPVLLNDITNILPGNFPFLSLLSSESLPCNQSAAG